eukprot:78691-Prymnesium_polylepis.2
MKPPLSIRRCFLVVVPHQRWRRRCEGPAPRLARPVPRRRTGHGLRLQEEARVACPARAAWDAQIAERLINACSNRQGGDDVPRRTCGGDDADGWHHDPMPR